MLINRKKILIIRKQKKRKILNYKQFINRHVVMNNVNFINLESLYYQVKYLFIFYRFVQNILYIVLQIFLFIIYS